MIIIHAQFQVKPEKVSEFLEEISVLVSASREESGNVSYELMKSTETDHAYTMVELWEGQEAVQSHNTSTHFQAFVEKAPQYLAAPLNARIFAGEEVKR
ncbi:antibiotic biosynthesis monooxygenase [Bacillus mangrovi]|uniref:Antibiotic biosynthesis monooxygenase n=1 Tax=Metabacillus mangrovi TaxID=1491830 RepID=A0A7X2S0P8_9BACI|nr:putative quinol monooxygenase [Metabacillus mangrovi]MTH51819.1 antibiotic biosynthesis monooxygenase [Metabacillus mangrovi]